MYYIECEKCKKIIKAKKESINNIVVFVMAIFTLLITDGLSFLPFSGLIFFFLTCLFCCWCIWFINKNNLYIKHYGIASNVKVIIKVVKKRLKK
jgi:hypothetical protein